MDKEYPLRIGFFGTLFTGMFILTASMTGAGAIPFMLSLCFTMLTLDLFLFQIAGMGFWFDDIKEFRKMMKENKNGKIDNQEVR